jgi:DNA-binding MarR family transcriptional regulator
MWPMTTSMSTSMTMSAEAAASPPKAHARSAPGAGPSGRAAPGGDHPGGAIRIPDHFKLMGNTNHVDYGGGMETEPAEAEGALVDVLAQSAFVVMGVLSRIGTRNDMSLTQLRVLGILRDRTLRMAELADFLGLDRSTMSGLVERAERRGLLERRKSPEDGRAVDVLMTAAGREQAERLHAELRRALAPVTGRLGHGECQALTRMLARMLPESNGSGIQPGRLR